jgi:hypothetical protein
MKKTLLSLTLMTVALFGKAQNCTDLIISEYVEGTNNNKALEFYNTSSSPISLANYRVIRWDNGSTSSDQNPEGVMQLPTNITLQPYESYVIALNLTDPTGTGQNAPIDLALQAKADTLLCPGCATGTGNSRVLCFNGDDALELQKTTNGGSSWAMVDIFACKGERPSNSQGTFSPTAGWTILFPFSSIPATYDSQTQGPYFLQYWSQDKTLKRKPTVKNGIKTNPAPETFNASVQWDTLSVNNFSGLGSHVCDCQQVGIKELNKSFAFVIYPNPAKNTIYLKSENLINQVVIYNVIGQEVKVSKLNKGLLNAMIDVSSLTNGVYTVLITDNLNTTSVRKLIIE